MLALIMAGGKGTRLNMGEKGLVRLCEKPLIEYVLTAVEDAGLDPVVVTTPRTPYTANYCRANGIDQICTAGAGYIEDISEAISFLGETGPVLITCADIPGVRGEHLEQIISAYERGDTEACSAWIPATLFEDNGCGIRYEQIVSGVSAVPAGMNILLGSKTDQIQTECCVLIEDPALIFNINSRYELSVAESFFSRVRSNPPLPR